MRLSIAFIFSRFIHSHSKYYRCASADKWKNKQDKEQVLESCQAWSSVDKEAGEGCNIYIRQKADYWNDTNSGSSDRTWYLAFLQKSKIQPPKSEDGNSRN